MFPNPSKRVKVEWIPLVEALNQYDNLAMCPFFPTHIYAMLDKMTRN